jgi:hypothetical protein
MRRYMMLLPLASAFLWNAYAQEATTPIAILNPEFNVDTLACSPGSNCSTFPITGWIVGPATGILKASDVQYPGTPADGIYVAYIGSPSTTGSIFQTLGVAVGANVTYTLTVTVGARADEVFTGYFAALGAGNVTLASGNTAIPLGGKFVTETIVYNSGASPAQLGQPLQILIKSLGSGQVNISKVTLTAK